VGAAHGSRLDGDVTPAGPPGSPSPAGEGLPSSSPPGNGNELEPVETSAAPHQERALVDPQGLREGADDGAAEETVEPAGQDEGARGGGDDEDDDEPSSDGGVELTEPSPRARRLGGMLLLVGLAIALLLGRRAMPRERAVVLRLPANRATIQSLRLGVASVAEAREQLTSSEWRFPAGGPGSPSVRAQVSLVDGPHEFEVVVVREGAVEARTTHTIVVTEDELTIAVPARLAWHFGHLHRHL
jgi:hypothetical protein